MRIWKNKGSKRLLLCYPRRSRTAFVEYYTAFKNKFQKEVKKVNKIPYFELKAVKVKKCQHQHDLFCGNFIKCSKCGNIIRIDGEEPKLKGNWVNGENLDKIKFPCFCSFKNDDFLIKIRKGLLNKVFFRGDYYYILADVSHQFKDTNCEPLYHSSNIELLFRKYDIHILKGKIIIFEEEE